MSVAHFNYYPPAGAVVDASDGRVTWDGKTWRLNGKVYNMPSSHRLAGKSGGPLSGWTYDWQKHAWMEPSAPKPPPTSPSTGLVRRPSPQRPAPQRPAPTVVAVETKKLNPLESIMKHPVAPLLGGVLVAAAYLTDEPQPPQIPDALPSATAKQWQMVYSQNQQRFQRRMDLFKDAGMVLLGYSSAQTIIDAFPKHAAAVLTTPADASVHAASVAAHRKM